MIDIYKIFILNHTVRIVLSIALLKDSFKSYLKDSMWGFTNHLLSSDILLLKLCLFYQY